ncbi:MAG TPA: PQQ-binding-like beta-propeller repeat protein [Myxococcales bacterium]|nr:PQQ-binding-like beta-propeller repeat protein [Myxococcales bacterium]
MRAAMGLALALACAPPPPDVALLTSERAVERRTLYTIDWRAQVRSDLAPEPPLNVDLLRWAPQETASPTVIPIEQEVVVGSTAGVLHAFSLDGQPLWEARTVGAITTSATYAEGRVYVAAGGGSVYAFDAASGRQLWSHDLGEEPATPPVVSAGAIYVATHQASVFAIDAATGERKWHYRRERERPFTLRTVAAPRPAGDVVYTGFSDGEIVALSVKSGDVVWQKSSGPGDQFVDADATPQLLGSHVYVASFAEGVSALDEKDGGLAWHVSFRGVTGLLLGNGILFATAIGKVAAFAPTDGSLLWEKGLGERSPGPPRLAGSVLAVPTTEEILLLDQHSGTQLGQGFSPGRGVDAPPAFAGRELYVLSNAGWLYALGIR